MAVSVTPRLIMLAAERRGWRSHIIDEGMLLYWLERPDGKRYYLRGITSIMTAAVNGYIADRKEITAQLIAPLGVPVPPALIIGDDTSAAVRFLREHGTVVVKPTNASHGNGVTVGICDETALNRALEYAGGFAGSTMIQKHLTGDDYRVLMIGGKLAAAAVRKPAYVIGDGQHSVAELIAIENKSPRRAAGYNTMLTHIDVEAATRFLGADALAAVPAANEEVQVVGTANIGKGGVSIDVTDTIDQRLVQSATKIVEHFGMNVCGIDFIMSPQGEYYLIEINSGPSLGLHEYPYSGSPRNTPDRFLDLLATA